MFVPTLREQIAALLALDLSVAEVARRTNTAYTTVSYHRDRLRQNLGATTVAPPEKPTHVGVRVTVKTRDEVHRLLREGQSRANVARALGVSKSTVSYHARRFGMPIDSRAARRYDWREIQAYYDEGHSVEECRARFGFCKAAWSAAARRGDVVARALAMPLADLLHGPRGRANLKRRLLKARVLHPRCRECGIEDWRGQPLALELHHINGERHDNRLENLALLCPNCHSQTGTWGGRNGRQTRNPSVGGESDGPTAAALGQRAA
jgi:DNA-binding CsgD family transcriptional regulator/5-methylcytosine-specific restriction endonuclease McrA